MRLAGLLLKILGGKIQDKRKRDCPRKTTPHKHTRMFRPSADLWRVAENKRGWRNMISRLQHQSKV